MNFILYRTVDIKNKETKIQLSLEFFITYHIEKVTEGEI